MALADTWDEHAVSDWLLMAIDDGLSWDEADPDGSVRERLRAMNYEIGPRPS